MDWRGLPLLLSMALLGLSYVSPARAQPLLVVTTSDCSAFSRDDVARSIEAELGASAAAPDQTLATRITIICKAHRVILRVLDPLSRKSVQRSIDLSRDAEGTRRRVVALAATELVLASWAELTVNPSPKVTPEGPAPDRQALQSAQELVRRQAKLHERQEQGRNGAHVSANLDGDSTAPGSNRPNRFGASSSGATASAALEARDWEPRQAPVKPVTQRWRITALVSTRSLLSRPIQLWGGGIRVGGDHRGIVAWSLDALYEIGRFRTGDEDSYILGSSTLGASVGFAIQRELFTARLGAVFRVGQGSTTRVNTSDSSGNGTSSMVPWGWPSTMASVSCWAGGLVLDLSGELGYAAAPRASGSNGTNPLLLGGAWASVQVGLGFKVN